MTSGNLKAVCRRMIPLGLALMLALRNIPAATPPEAADGPTAADAQVVDSSARAGLHRPPSTSPRSVSRRYSGSR